MPSSGFPGLTTPPNPPPAPPVDLKGVVGWLGNFTTWFQGLSRWLFSVYTVMNNILIGKINVAGDVTLTAASATTTLTDSRITATCVIEFMPTTSNAALAKSLLYVSSRTKGSATLSHGIDASTDRTYRYSIIG